MNEKNKQDVASYRSDMAGSWRETSTGHAALWALAIALMLLPIAVALVCL